MEITKRKAVNDALKKYCILAKDNDYIEVTEWTNGLGFDVDINEKKKISLTRGEIEAILYLVKALDYNEC